MANTATLKASALHLDFNVDVALAADTNFNYTATRAGKIIDAFFHQTGGAAATYKVQKLAADCIITPASAGANDIERALTLDATQQVIAVGNTIGVQNNVGGGVLFTAHVSFVPDPV
jgi:hypothetical protein